MKLTERTYWPALQYDFLRILNSILSTEGAILKGDLESRLEVQYLLRKYMGDIVETSKKTRVSDIIKGLTIRGRAGPSLLLYEKTGNKNQKIIREISTEGKSILDNDEKKHLSKKLNEHYFYRELLHVKERLTDNNFLKDYKNQTSLILSQIDQSLLAYYESYPAYYDEYNINFFKQLTIEELEPLVLELPIPTLSRLCYILYQQKNLSLNHFLEVIIKNNKEKWTESEFDNLFELYLLHFLINEDKRDEIVELFQAIKESQKLFYIAKSLKFLNQFSKRATEEFLVLVPPNFYDIKLASQTSRSWSYSYLEFLSEIFKINYELYRALIDKFLYKINGKPIKEVFSILIKIFHLYSSKNDFYSDIDLLKYLETYMSDCSDIISIFFEIENLFKEINLSKEEISQIKDFLKVETEFLESEHMINLLKNLKWSIWTEDKLIYQIIQDINPKFIVSSLTSIKSPLIMGEVLMGLNKVSNSIAQTVLDKLGTSKILDYVNRFSSFDDFRFLLYGVRDVNPSFLDILVNEIQIAEIVPLIKPDQLSFFAWFYVELQKELPEFTLELFELSIQSIYENYNLNGISQEFAIMIEILWKNNCLSKDIVDVLTHKDIISLFPVWSKLEFFPDLILLLDENVLVKWIESLSYDQKLIYCQLIKAEKQEESQIILRKITFPQNLTIWQNIFDTRSIRATLSFFDNLKLEWLRETHPNEYSILQKFILHLKLRDLFDSGILYSLKMTRPLDLEI